MDERRRHKRIREKDRVTVKVLSSPSTPSLENRTFFCDTQDISAMGLRFLVDTPFPVGATVELRVALHRPLRAFKHIGRVTWREKIEEDAGYATGVEFDDPQCAKVVAWKDLVSRKAADA